MAGDLELDLDMVSCGGFVVSWLFGLRLYCYGLALDFFCLLEPIT